MSLHGSANVAARAVRCVSMAAARHKCRSTDVLLVLSEVRSIRLKTTPAHKFACDDDKAVDKIPPKRCQNGAATIVRGI